MMDIFFKVFSIEEMREIAEVIKKWPKVLVVCDEVYEHLTYDGLQHHHFASIPDM